VLIDGSNLALYGQNWAHGGFDFAQIGAAYDHAVAQFPDLKPLVVRRDPHIPRFMCSQVSVIMLMLVTAKLLCRYYLAGTALD